MEVELKRLEDLADAIVNDFAYMRQREQEMRDTNGEKNTLIQKLIVLMTLKVFVWFDIVSPLFCTPEDRLFAIMLDLKTKCNQGTKKFNFPACLLGKL